MKGSESLRQWATPVTIGAFVLSAVTGMALFFGLDSGLITPAHEWLGWVLIAGTILHLAANWRLTVRRATRPPGRVIVAVFLLLTCASFVPVPGHEVHPEARVLESLSRAPLSVVARAAGHTPDEARRMLEAKGLRAADPEQTVQGLAESNGTDPHLLLELIF